MTAWRDFSTRRQRPVDAYGADRVRWPAGRHDAADPAALESARRLDAVLDRAVAWRTAESEARVAAGLAVLPPQDRRRFLSFSHPFAASAPGRAPWPAFAALAMASVIGIVIGGSDIGASIAGGPDADYSVLDDTPTLTAALEP
jgi:hypothetical protein